MTKNQLSKHQLLLLQSKIMEHTSLMYVLLAFRWLDWVGFMPIRTFVAYLMPVYVYIKYMAYKQIVCR